MEKTTMMKVWKGLPVAVAAVLVLGGCGGGGSDSVAATPSNSGSITACFTANSTVNFAMTSIDVPPGQILPNRSTTGPMTYNGQAVTGQTSFYPSGTITTNSNYWTITSGGIRMIASVINNSTVVPDGTFWPQNSSPGQTATDSNNNVFTFIGFEAVSLAGKTFTNTCHIKGVDPQNNVAEGWYAPGYGLIKQVGTTGTSQYNGDL